MLGSPGQIVIGLGVPLINLTVIGFALVEVLRLALRGQGMNIKAVPVEPLRIDERLTSIEKLLKNIEGPGRLRLHFTPGSCDADGT
jgi:hypothetical protein